MYEDLLKVLIDTNILLHRHEEEFNYHIIHCYLMESYMNLIADKYDKYNFDKSLFPIIAFGHDLLKDRENKFSTFYQKNTSNRKRFFLSDSMYNSLSTHAYRSAEFLSNYPFNVTEGKILFPILFHSIPIIDVMIKYLSPATREYINLTMLCDKLSSNYWRITNGIKTWCDLDKIVFGDNGDELNYNKGLYYARLLNGIKYKNKYSIQAEEYYRKLYDPSVNIKLEEKKLWEKRNNQQLKMQWNISTTLLKDVNLQDWNTWIISFSENEKIIRLMS